jgi:hypothetical protein
MSDVDGELEETSKYLRFANPFVTPIRVRAKTLTVRYEFERDLDVGDRVDLVNVDDVVFARAEIDLAMTMTIAEFVRLEPTGHAPYDDVDDLIETLSVRYDTPTDAFDPSTELDVFGFEVVDRE